jgi:hypothetical protein
LENPLFKRLVLAGAVGALALQFMGLSPADAKPKDEAPSAKIIGNVRVDSESPSIAYVTAKYSCPPGPAHLWVSVKQVATGEKDPALTQEGSSGISSAWLQRHPGADEFTCDGTMHSGTFSIDAGLTEYGFGELQQAHAYVQFCLTGPETGPEGEPAWFAIDQRFAPAH